MMYMVKHDGFLCSLRRIGAVACFALLVAACGGGAEEERFVIGFDGEIIRPGDPIPTTPPTTAPTSVSVDAAPEVTESSTTEPALEPAALAFSTDELRRTAEGIAVEAYLGELDVGNGPEPRWWIEATAAFGRAGVTFDPEVPAAADIVGVTGWAASAEVTIIRLEVGSQIPRVRVTGSHGFDEVSPDSSGFALLAVRAQGPEHTLVEAFDDSGAVAGTCTHDGTFFDCPG